MGRFIKTLNIHSLNRQDSVAGSVNQATGLPDFDLRSSADTMKAITDLQSDNCAQAILKIRPPSSLDYRACHGPQTILTL